MRNIIASSLFLVPVLLTACHAPGVMPRGYSSFREPYKSAPGTQAQTLGYAYGQEKNTAIIEAMRPAARDLLTKFEKGMPPSSATPITLQSSGGTAFYSALDHVLREELAYRGYNITTDPQAHSYPVFLSAVKAQKDSHLSDTGTERIEIALSGAEKILASGSYDLPAYGFVEVSPPGIQAPAKATSKQGKKDDGALPPAEETGAPMPITKVTSEPLSDAPASGDLPPHTTVK